ncbi:MAG: HEPN domain-containing protein [Anaerolineae bacterium]
MPSVVARVFSTLAANDINVTMISQSSSQANISIVVKATELEKALKALFRRLGMDAWGHTLTALIGNLPSPVQPDEALIQCAKVLDKHYIPTRYPNGFDSGAPTDFYTAQEAEQAIECAARIVTFCHDQIGRPEHDCAGS